MAETMVELNKMTDEYEIQMGTTSYADTANAFKTVSVTFPKAFKNTPKVMVTYTALGSGSMGAFGASNVTKTGFSLGSWSEWSQSVTRTFDWVAIAKK